MKRYLLFDSGCHSCSELAQTIEREAEGWLIARSLRDAEMQSLLKKADPNYRWEPALLEVKGEKINVATGLNLMAKIATGLGIKKAWRISKLVRQIEAPSPVQGERRRFLRQGGALLASLPLLSLPSSAGTGALSNSKSTELEVTSWQRYRDEDYNFTLEFPSGWQTKVTERQPEPLVDDEAILKRVVFSSQTALVYLDVWLAKGKDLTDWLTWYKETRLVDQMPTEANAIVAGQSATAFLQEHQRDLMITYVSDGEYVYRLLNWMTGVSTHLDAYWHMLDTFTLLETRSAIATELPPAVKQNAEQSAAQSTIGIQVANCCTYYDSGNPFPCCIDGNCTWWVYYQMNGVPFTGNAGTWWGQVPDYGGWARAGSPPYNKSSIAWKSGGLGHVAYVATFSGAGNEVDITDMCCGDEEDGCWECMRSTTRSISHYGGFIYRTFS